MAIGAGVPIGRTVIGNGSGGRTVVTALRCAETVVAGGAGSAGTGSLTGALAGAESRWDARASELVIGATANHAPTTKTSTRARDVRVGRRDSGASCLFP